MNQTVNKALSRNFKLDQNIKALKAAFAKGERSLQSY